MLFCDICEIYKSSYFEEHLPKDASINERQQETQAFLDKKNESHYFSKPIARAVVLPENYSYLNPTQVLNSVVQCYIFGLYWSLSFVKFRAEALQLY